MVLTAKAVAVLSGARSLASLVTCVKSSQVVRTLCWAETTLCHNHSLIVLSEETFWRREIYVCQFGLDYGNVFLLLYSRARTDDMRDVLASHSLRCQVGLMQSHMCVLSPSDHCCGDDSGQKPLFLKPPRSKSTLYLIVSYYPFYAMWIRPMILHSIAGLQSHI